MLAVVVDPYLIALPDPCNSADDLENFVDNLLAWAEALEREDLMVLVSENCVDALLGDNLYPYDHEFMNLWSLYLEDAEIPVDKNTVSNLIRRLLATIPTFEQHIDIQDVVYEEEFTSIEPVDFLTRLKYNSSKALEKCFVMLGIWHHWGAGLPNMDSCVFAAGICERTRQCQEISIESKATFIEPYQSNNNSYVVPCSVREIFHVCFGHIDVLKQIGCLALWGSADSEARAVDAINLRIKELIEDGIPVSNLLSFRLGARFLASVQQEGFIRSDLAMNLIDTCARISVQTPKNSLNHFRNDKRSQAPQLQRQSDGALAWRTHLTKHGAGFRLMFWRLADGSIEFANVGSKFKLEIYE